LPRPDQVIHTLLLAHAKSCWVRAMMVRILFWSILGGVVITLLTGLVSNTPATWVGAVLYGYPLAWLSRLVLAPEYFPWRIDWANLILDILVWVTIIRIALFMLTRPKK